MKKKLICILLILLISLSLTSCGFNTGYHFIEGVFYSSKNNITDEDKDLNEDYEHAILTITKIDEKQFLEADGLNVVKDVSGYRTGDYFFLELLVFSKEKNDYKQLNFYNLKRIDHIYANIYTDDYGDNIIPSQSKYSVANKGYSSGFYPRKTTDN